MDGRGNTKKCPIASAEEAKNESESWAFGVTSCPEDWAAKGLTFKDSMVVGVGALLDGRADHAAAQGKASPVQGWQGGA